MPQISAFYGIVITMYYDDHPPPHLHARYAEAKAIYTIAGVCLHGQLPPRADALVQNARAPARFAILACCGLAVLSGFGFQSLQRRLSGVQPRRILLIATLVAIGLEYGSAPMRLERLSTG